MLVIPVVIVFLLLVDGRFLHPKPENVDAEAFYVRSDDLPRVF